MVMSNQRTFLLEKARYRANREKLGLRDNQCGCHKDHCSYCHPQQHKEKCNDPCNQFETTYHKWNALDRKMEHPMSYRNPDEGATQNSQVKNMQTSDECIVIKDSCDVNVSTTDTQAAVNVQVAIQAAIALVISISIADGKSTDEVTADLFGKLKSSQVNNQQLYIENSRDIEVSTTDTDIAVNAQVMLQVLIAIVVRLNVL